MRILDRYIIKGLIFPFAWCLILFIFLYIIIDLFGHLDDILNAQVELAVISRYYLSFIPLIFVQITPIAILLASIYLLGALTKHNEIIAMKANGIGLWRLLRPFLFLGIVMSLAVFIINEKIVPSASFNAEIIKDERIEKGKSMEEQKEIRDVTLYGEGNRLFYGAVYEVGKNILKNITILEHNEDMQPASKITAAYAQWTKNGKWKLYDCIVQNFNLSSTPLTKGIEELSSSSQEAGPAIEAKETLPLAPGIEKIFLFPAGTEKSLLLSQEAGKKEFFSSLEKAGKKESLPLPEEEAAKDISPDIAVNPQALVTHYPEIVLDIKERPEDFLKPEGRAEFMNYPALKNYIERLSGGGKEVIRNLQVDLYYKLSFPLISLVVLMLGIPFSLTTSRGGTLRGIGICITISLFYYGVTAIGIGLGKGGMLPPLLSAWLGNIVFGTTGAVLLGKIRM